MGTRVRLVATPAWSQQPPKPIDLSCLRLLRDRDLEDLLDARCLERELLPQLGLNDENFHEFPDELRVYAGRGLRAWQYPIQLSRYLVELAGRKVESYLEIGVRHGGTFVLTVEYLRRVHLLRKAVGIDLNPGPNLHEYVKINPACRIEAMSSHSSRFHELVTRDGPFDLVLIDGDHSRDGCRRDFKAVAGSARMIAFHDICDGHVSGVAEVWRNLRDHGDEFEFFEYADQYDEVKRRTGRSYMGIGLAVSKARR